MPTRPTPYGWSVCCLAGLLLLAAATAGHAEERARTLVYDPAGEQFVETPPPPPGTAAGMVYEMEQQLRDQRYGRVLRLAKRFKKAYGEGDAQYPAVLICRAKALIGQRSFSKAHDVLQEYLNQYAGFELTGEAWRLEFVIAETYLGGTKRKVWGLRWFSGEEIALRIMDDLAAGGPDQPLAPLALKTKADYLFRRGEYELAELDYARLVRDHPHSRYHQVSLRRTAESALASFAGVPYDGSALIEAQERYRDYRQVYPGPAEQEGVDVVLQGIAEQQAAKEVATGQYYERTDHLASAVFYYQRVVQHWPNTVAATQARDRLALLEPAEAVEVPEGRDTP